MRLRIGSCLMLVLALSLTTALVSGASAGQRKRTTRGDVLLKAQPVSFSGEFSGALRGEISVGGVRYRLAPDATVYEVGRGSLPLGTMLDGRLLSLNGLKYGDRVVVYGVVVRPASDVALSGSDPGSFLHIVEGPTAQ